MSLHTYSWLSFKFNKLLTSHTHDAQERDLKVTLSKLRLCCNPVVPHIELRLSYVFICSARMSSTGPINRSNASLLNASTWRQQSSCLMGTQLLKNRHLHCPSLPTLHAFTVQAHHCTSPAVRLL